MRKQCAVRVFGLLDSQSKDLKRPVVKTGTLFITARFIWWPVGILGYLHQNVVCWNGKYMKGTISVFIYIREHHAFHFFVCQTEHLWFWNTAKGNICGILKLNLLDITFPSNTQCWYGHYETLFSFYLEFKNYPSYVGFFSTFVFLRYSYRMHNSFLIL